MKIKSLVALGLFCAAVAAPCAQAGEVLVSAAASLTNAFKAAGQQFEQRHPGTKVLFSFGSSDAVLRQIINGAPADVFASADQTAMDKAVSAKMVDPATRVNFGMNQVVLIVPSNSALHLSSVDDLGGKAVKRITLGNPASVPVGRYTKDLLEKSGHWKTVKAKAILANNVRQALDYVARDEVDAGFVYATDAAIMPDKVKVVQHLTSPVPVLYPIALTTRKGRSPQAQAFVDFVLSPAGQAILAKYGFKKP
jgi:molybdate transport system substrate-binding protein